MGFFGSKKTGGGKGSKSRGNPVPKSSYKGQRNVNKSSGSKKSGTRQSKIKK